MNRLKINDKICYLVEPTKDKILDLKGGEPTLILDEYAKRMLLEDKVDIFIFEFGGWFYYTPKDEVKLKDLNILKYIGEYEWEAPIPEQSRVFLGIHGKYELMCGLHDYKLWAKKAKFLGYKALGICEKNTLAGAIQFSNACEKQGITPIIGVQFRVKCKGGYYWIKLFAATQEGWEHLMEHNSQATSIRHEDLLETLSGCIALVQPGQDVTETILEELNEAADQTYFQYTTTRYVSSGEEDSKKENMRWHLRQYKGKVKGVLMNDTYCLDQDMEHLQQVVVTQGGGQGTRTENHHFPPYDDMVFDFMEYFHEEDMDLYKQVMRGTVEILDKIHSSIDFRIRGEERFLPKYEMTKEEKEIYGDNETMFKELIADGLDRLIDPEVHDERVVMERIAREGALIKKGGVIDYFLILWDIINWCRKERIETGPGRGSAAGSIISYLLGITKVNPLDYDLLFERFLDESRVTTSLPDIDVDFASDRRDEVLRYMRDRYEFEYVCQVGTYGSLKLKSSIRELARYHGLLTPEHLNYLTKVFSDEDSKFIDIFRRIGSTSDARLIQFVRKNYIAVNDISSLIGSLKNSSIHACATIIAPKLGRDIKKQIPIRVHPDGTLVSEWEGGELEDAGYLKEDILSTAQMAKIGTILKMIEKHTGKRIYTEEIPLDDPNVFDMFCKGITQDVFHFGSSGLTAYLNSVQPRELEELIAANALYRPGTMASEAHMDFVRLKNGEQDPEYDYMLKEVTENTYGLYVYQEQIMKAVQVLGGLTLAEANDVRKAMGKKIKEKLESYSAKFLAGAIERGCPEEQAKLIWEKLERFSAYGFNKSHAAAYSVIGYTCNWLKYHYPMEFWITAFQYGSEDDIPDYVSEITRTTDIHVAPPNINTSNDHFTYDLDKKEIYWDLSKIKFVGDQGVRGIIMEREENGQYFSLKEFWERMNEFDPAKVGGKVKCINKRSLQQLIVSGAFDKMYHITNENLPKRYEIIQEMYSEFFPKEEIPARFQSNWTEPAFWAVEQYQACKLSSINLRGIVEEDDDFYMYMDDYVSGEAFNMMNRPGPAVVIGMVDSFTIKMTKKKDPFATIRLLHGTDIINVRVWSGELCNPKEEERLTCTYQEMRYNEETEQDELTDVRCDMKTMLEKFPGKMVIMRGNLELPDQWKPHNELVMSGYIKGPILKFL